MNEVPAAELSAELVVVGAGVAGLAASRALAEAGRTVITVEARDRVGGRISTLRSRNPGEASSSQIELGAEFIHGEPPDLLALIREAGLDLYERDGAVVQACARGSRTVVREPVEDGRSGICALELLKDYVGPDLSFKDFLDRESVSGSLRASAINFAEGLNAADHQIASSLALGKQQRAEDAIQGERTFCLREGYDRLPEYIAQCARQAGAQLILRRPARRVEWVQGSVIVHTDQGVIRAEKAIITLPLAVLQAGTVKIVPEPKEVLQAAGMLRMGQVCRFTLLFRERFWQGLSPYPAMDELSFLMTPSELPAVWWTAHPASAPTLTGWIGGPNSAAFLGKDAEALGRQGCATLARTFGLLEERVRSQLIACYTHRWDADEYALGAYSYVAVNGADASGLMSTPVEQTLFFAGEHTDTTGHWGTVHGALRSGVRAARQVLGSA